MSKHNAITKDETKLEGGNKVEESKFYLEMSAQPIRPAGTDYLGTLCVHVYASNLQADRQLMFATHTDAEIPEAVSDIAINDLREKAMASYGRSKPRRV